MSAQHLFTDGSDRLVLATHIVSHMSGGRGGAGGGGGRGGDGGGHRILNFAPLLQYASDL